jgi:hypothetical protein
LQAATAAVTAQAQRCLKDLGQALDRQLSSDTALRGNSTARKTNGSSPAPNIHVPNAVITPPQLHHDLGHDPDPRNNHDP